MKTVSFLIVLFAVFSLSANEKKEKMTLDEKKTKVIGHIDARIGSLNEFKSCVQSATEKKAIKQCRKTHKEKMKAFRDERKESRKK